MLASDPYPQRISFDRFFLHLQLLYFFQRGVLNPFQKDAHDDKQKQFFFF